MPTASHLKTERDLDQLRQLALRMGGLAEEILANALRATWRREVPLAAAVKADDLEIDRIDVEIDEAVLNVLALRAPVAIDLRQVLAIKTMATDLERVGDLARNIAGCAQRLANRSPVAVPAELKTLAEAAQRALSESLGAFADLDVSRARAVLAADDEIDEIESRFIRDAIAKIEADPSTSGQQIDFMFVARSLERVGDHATNIAEHVVLAAESENLKHREKLAR
jgi:phosphate transport system protein